MKQPKSEFHGPLVTDRDGFGCCLACKSALKAGEPHKPDCLLAAAQKPAPEPYDMPTQLEMARDIANRIYAMRRQEEREELDRIANSPPRRRKKTKEAGS